MRSHRLVTAALAVAMLTSACASDDTTDLTDTEPDSTEASADGTLTIYSGRSEDLVGTVIADFEAATGIDVEVRYGDTAELAALLLEEGDASPADVYWAQDAGALGAVSQEGLFAELPQDILDRVEAGNRSAEGDWVGVTGRARTIV